MISYLRTRIKSFGYAFRGIAELFRNTPNARIHLLAVIVITMMGLWLRLSGTEWCFIIICMSISLTAEAVNTAIEHVVDLASPDIHPLAGKAKDVAAGAVLLSVIFGGIVWGLIFIPKLFALFSN